MSKKEKSKLDKIVGKKIREKFWPNWSYKGEYINSEGKLIMVFHDKDFPEFEKKIMLQARIDLNDVTIPRKYMYTQQQLIHDHVLRHIKLATGKQIELRFSAINRSGGENGGALTQPEIDELYQIVNAFEWRGIIQSIGYKRVEFNPDNFNQVKESKS
jgi:hypothetical protein